MRAGILALLVALQATSLADAGESSGRHRLDPGLSAAVREADARAIGKLLDAADQLNARDEVGNTPLILAALQADLACLRLLLDRGADPDARNDSGTSAMMMAAGDPEKVRALLDAGADPNARSGLGNTPLILAARYSRSEPVLRLLLERGAKPEITNRYGVNALLVAASSGDNESLRLLLDRGVAVNTVPSAGENEVVWGGGQTALMWAASRGDEAAVKLLLDRGANVDLRAPFGSPLIMAAQRGEAGVARLLLDRGAKVDLRPPFTGFTPLMWASGNEADEPALVELLLARGAEVNATGGHAVAAFMDVPQTSLMWAARRGKTSVVEALRRAGARERPDPWSARNPRPPGRDLLPGLLSSDVLARAVAAAVPQLEEAALVSYRDFEARNQKCVSCHNQYLPLLALGTVKKKGLSRDEDAARSIVRVIEDVRKRLVDRTTEPTFHPSPSHSIGYSFMAMAAEERTADYYTDAEVHCLASMQAADGRWYNYMPRPPIQSTDVSATALGIRALSLYPLPGRGDEFAKRVARAREWLARVEARFTEERSFQLLGLAWAGEGSARLSTLGKALAAVQREDGGWAQLPKLPSDAYATGQALVALHQAAELPVSDPVYQRGLRYLLRTQLADGTWFVRRRAFPFQPTMKSGFPHGRDGWISAAATSWATVALVTAVDARKLGALGEGGEAVPSRSSVSLGEDLPPRASRPVDFAADIRPILEGSCLGCHGAEKAKSRYRVDTRAKLLAGGAHGEAAVLPGQSAKSPLIHYVAGLVEDLEMPPVARREKFPALTRDQVGLLRAWIDQGARWPDED